MNALGPRVEKEREALSVQRPQSPVVQGAAAVSSVARGEDAVLRLLPIDAF